MSLFCPLFCEDCEFAGFPELAQILLYTQVCYVGDALRAPNIFVNVLCQHILHKEELKTMALVPLGDRILVKRSEEDEQTTSGGIIIPDTAKEKPQEGEVVAIGNGRLLDSGERQPVDVAVGDLVLFAKYGGTEVTYDGTEYLILREDDILAKMS